MAPIAAPPSCYLCGGTRISLRFAARGVGSPPALASASSASEPGSAAPATVSAYACTNFGHLRHGPIWCCADCGLVFLWPHPDARALAQSYREVEDPLYATEKENRYLTFRRIVGQLGAGEGRRLLDVGAYCGYFADVARGAGFAAEGLELSRWAAAQARALGLTIAESTLEEFEDARGFDAVTLWDVIEHFADPRLELQHVASLLRPGGLAWLSTIDVGSLTARAFGSRWPWLMEMHLFYFDRRTLALLLEQSGLELVETRLYTHVVSLGYLLRKLGSLSPLLRGVFNLAARVLPTSWAIPVNLGDNMLMVARKPPHPPSPST